jgi:hypothetical protein
MKPYWLALALLMPACAPSPSWYPVAAQHQHPVTEEVIGYGEYVRSGDPTAESHYIRDVKPLEGGSWRWTLDTPEFRFYLAATENRTFRLDFAIADATFKDTGPVRMEVLINGHLLDRPVFDRAGNHVYNKPVPSAMLGKNAENRVVIRVLNAWQAPDPGVRLGFLLHAVGFVRT